MIKVAFFFSFLLFAYFGTTSASTCSKVNQYKYTTKLEPECHEKDQKILWPNYEDQTYYIKCVAPGKAEKVKCKEDDVFVYVYQLCKPCEKYLPPMECPKLPTTNPPECKPIENNGNGGETTVKPPTTKPTVESTPRYPPSTATTKDANTPTVPPPTVTEESNTTRVTENITKPESTESPTNTDFPGPPSPPSTDPDVPQPETPQPTPPVVNATPPSAGK